MTNEVLLTVIKHFKRPNNPSDRYDTTGKNIAMKLWELSKHQMLIVEKIINETLYEDELGNLTFSHILIYDALQSFKQRFTFRSFHTPTFSKLDSSIPSLSLSSNFKIDI